MPRLGRQKNRTNVNVNYPGEFFCFAIAIPFNVDYIQQMKDRFSNREKLLFSLHLLIPIM